MSVPTIAITGVVLPPDSAAVGGSIRFRLSGQDVDTNNAIVAPREIIVALVGGAFSVDLWPTARGDTERSYTADVSLAPASPDARRAWVEIGSFSLPAAPSSWEFGALLLAHGTVLPNSPSILSQVLQARADAVAAAEAAQRAQSVASILPITSNYTLNGGNKGMLIASTGAGAVTVTIPTDAAGGFAETVVITFQQTGTGVLSIAAAAGVTLNGVNGGATEIQQAYGAAQIIRYGSNEWTIIGLTDEVTL